MAVFGTGAGTTLEQLRHSWRTVSVRLRPLARRAWHPLAALVILGVAYIALGGVYYASGRGLQESSERAASARRALSRPAPQAGQLTLALRGWELVLVASQSSRVGPIADTELVRRTLDLADTAGVTVIDAGTRPEFVEDIDGLPYRAVPYLVRARGSLSEIEDFLHLAETGLVDTLEVRGAIVTGDGDEYVLTLSCIVYNHLPETGSAGGDDPSGQAASPAVSATTGGG